MPLDDYQLAAKRSHGATSAVAFAPWPGNIRELRKTIERAAKIIEPEAFPVHISARVGFAAPQLGGDFPLETIEREHIARVIARAATLDERRRFSASMLRFYGANVGSTGPSLGI